MNKNINEFADQIYEKYTHNSVKELVGKERMLTRIMKSLNGLVDRYTSNIQDATQKYYRYEYDVLINEDEAEDQEVYFDKTKFDWVLFVNTCMNKEELPNNMDFYKDTNIKMRDGKKYSCSRESIREILYYELMGLIYNIIHKLNLDDVFRKLGYEDTIHGPDDEYYNQLLVDFFIFMNKDNNSNKN